MKLKAGVRQKVIPDGEYNAMVVDLRPGTFIGKRKTLEFIFEIADGEHKGTSLRAFANAHYETFTSFSKLAQWYEIITGEELKANDEIDTDKFLEKVLRVTVETRKSRKTGNQFSNVTKIHKVIYEI